MKRNFWLLRGLKFIFGAILLIAAVGYFAMWLWNSLIPELFNGPVLTYWQAVGLLVLSKLFLGGFRGGRPGGWSRHRQDWRRKMKRRMAHLTPEEQEQLQQKMRNSCRPAWMCRGMSEESVS